MKTCLRVLLALMLGAAAVAAHAQELRVGYVDMKHVLDNAPQVVAGRDSLDREFRPLNDAIDEDEALANELERQLLQGDINATDRSEMERDLREMRRNINRRREDLRDELSFRRTAEIQRLEAQINVAVEEIAQLHGFDLILSSPVVYASPALDVTDLILNQLQIEYDADRLEQALP